MNKDLIMEWECGGGGGAGVLSRMARVLDPGYEAEGLWPLGRPDMETARRKGVLYAVACCRYVWDFLDERMKRCVNEAESYADRRACYSDIAFEYGGFDQAYYGENLGVYDSSYVYYCAKNAVKRCLLTCLSNGVSLNNLVLTAVEAVPAYSIGKNVSPGLPNATNIWDEFIRTFRDVVGNPLGGVAFNPEWRTPDVLYTAKLAYKDVRSDFTLDPVNLALLSDALEEAGCEEAAWLEGLRSTGHRLYRGYWLLDEALGGNFIKERSNG